MLKTQNLIENNAGKINNIFNKMDELINYYDVNNNYNLNSNENNISNDNNICCNDINENKIVLESIKYCPTIDDSIINDLNEIYEKAKRKKKKRALLGVIKFIYNGDEYIHCPIKKVKSNGNFVKFGVCKHLDSLLNTKENRKKMSIHKFQFHYLSKSPDSDQVTLFLKTQNSLEEIIEKMKNKLKINTFENDNIENVSKLIFYCKQCGKKNKKLCCFQCMFCGNIENNNNNNNINN